MMALPNTRLAIAIAAALGYAGPLDAVPLSAWYSLRREQASHTGPCLRVIESGGSTEADIGYDAVTGMLDAVALMAHCGANSGYVVTWYGGLGNNATQATANKQPRIVNAGVIERGVYFDGSNDQLSIPAASALAITGGSLTAMTWLRRASGNTAGAWCRWDGNAGTRAWALYIDGALSNLGISPDGASLNSVGEGVDWSTSADTFVCGRTDSTNKHISRNNGAETSSAQATYNTGTGITTIGTLWDGVYQYNGHVFACYYAQSSLSGGDRSTVYAAGAPTL